MNEVVESSVNGSYMQLQSYGENNEEELAVLPRHTKVIVTGNNRTKSELVGLQGVVKKAIGLGGWHWLVLTNGLEVKLQRNALTVIEAPTGNEEEDDDEEEVEFDNIHSNSSASPRFDRRNGLNKCSGSSFSSSSPHKTANRDVVPVLHSDPHHSRIDFGKLEIGALRKYWRHFKLDDGISNSKLSKEQLVDAVQRHFMSQQLDELQVIPGFVQAAKRLKNKNKNVCN